MTREAVTAADRRRVARAWRRRHLLWAAIFGAGFGFGVGAGPLLAAPVAEAYFPDALRLRELTVVGTRRLAPEEVAAAAALAPNGRLDHIETGAVARRIEAHPWIARARVAALSPGALVVSVEEREPAATVAGDGDATWWVDGEGVAFALVEDAAEGAAFPRIDGLAEIAPGRADARLAQGVRIAGATRERGLRGLREVRLGGDDPHALPSLRLARPRARVLLGGDDLDAKLKRLARLLAADLPEVAAASAIDLRFGERTVLRSDASWMGDAEAEARGSAPPSGTGPAG